MLIELFKYLFRIEKSLGVKKTNLFTTKGNYVSNYAK